MNNKNFIIFSTILFILILTNNIEAQGVDINVIIVEDTDIRTNDVGVPSISVNFPIAERGLAYVTDMEDADILSPYPFVIRNIGNNPVDITIESVIGDNSVNCVPGSGDPFCSSDSKAYFWVEQAYAGDAIPWSSLDACGIGADSCFLSTPYSGGGTCKSTNFPTGNSPASCCVGGADCLEIGGMLFPNAIKIIEDLKSLDGTGGNTRNEALLHVKIYVAGAGDNTPEPSGAKTARIKITGGPAS